MVFYIGKNREAKRVYGFDEVAIAPGEITINPDETDISTRIGGIKLEIPFLASAMDAVVDVNFAIKFNNFGGLAVLNLDGIQTRYEFPEEAYEKILKAAQGEVTEIIKKIYSEPVKEKLIQKRIQQIKEKTKYVCVSTIPQNAEKYFPIVIESGVSIFVVQGTIITAKHISTSYKPLDLYRFCKNSKIPIILGNCATYRTALELMETGCSAILVGIGPGSACTSREVLGIGIPQVTATIDCAAARDYYFKKTGRYISVITDGGMNTGGDICKAFVSGADAVMLGGALARSKEAPGKGYHWGMAMPHHYLPRGTRIYVGVTGTLEEIIFGPAKTDDGTQNLVGALRMCMGYVGAKNIKELQLAELVIAPEIKHEGKIYQKIQKRI